MKNTLLERALRVKTAIRKSRLKYNEKELLELTLAYFNGKIGTTAVVVATRLKRPRQGAGNTHAYGIVAGRLRRAVEAGEVKLMMLK